jgi:hypothetical protein
MNANRTMSACTFALVCAIGSLQWPGTDAGIVLLVVAVVVATATFLVSGAD